jgi:lipopolysaccharide biosynthesis glycosyltransferase
MMEKKRNIHIAIAFDNNYIKPFYVLLTSIFLNNNKGIKVTVGEIIGVSDGFTIIHRVHDRTSIQFWTYEEPPF